MYVVNKIRENERKRLNSEQGYSQKEIKTVKFPEIIPNVKSFKSNKSAVKNPILKSRLEDNTDFYDNFFNKMKQENLKIKHHSHKRIKKNKKVETVAPSQKKSNMISIEPDPTPNLLNSVKVPVLTKFKKMNCRETYLHPNDENFFPKLLEKEKSKRSTSEMRFKNTLKNSILKANKETMFQTQIEEQIEVPTKKGCFIFSCFGVT
jgi:hypothetical protein